MILVGMYIGIIKLSSYHNYWCRLLGFPTIADPMLKKCYELLRCYLVNNDTIHDVNDKLFKIKLFLVVA